ncbi:MAG TPA: hypothetical protein EYQ50_22330 [Verrucomicrobiales bacterium]|nr:hypothetical protein [Verrucomicrobiales bacterium]HIL69234.1 hypothetical protein [Verrucomicrobiota bacterium]
MTSIKIQDALADITAESDPTLKHLKLASLVCAIFRVEEIELVVVGGSAIEFYTDGAYVSGDLDLCVANATTSLTIRLRQKLMGRVQGVGGPRSWKVAGSFVDVLGGFENLALTPLRKLNAPHGPIEVSPVEELIVERILISKYPGKYPPARDCAKKLLAVALQKEVETDWEEVRRLAMDRAYDNWNDVKELIDEQAEVIQVRSPYDPNE